MVGAKARLPRPHCVGLAATRILAKCSNMSKKLEQLWYQQGGRCLYRDGPTYLPSSENKDQARRRLAIEPGVRRFGQAAQSPHGDGRARLGKNGLQIL
jgi:hypothetical protein